MEKLKWIIDVGFDDNSNEKLINSLKKANANYIEFNYKLFMNKNDIQKELGSIDSDVMSYGSINFISKLQKIDCYKPGSFCNFSKLEYRNYSRYFKKYLLNNKYLITTWKDFQNNFYNIINTYGISNCIFIRPNSGKKVFTGMITTIDSWCNDLSFYSNRMNDNTLLIISTPKNIVEEWRFFVSYDKVITGSLFHKNGELNLSKNYDKNAFELAKKVSKIYLPDPIFVVDICKTVNGDYKIVELNGFSCSGIYDCSTDLIVKEISRLSRREGWKN